MKKWVRTQYPHETDEGVFSYELVERFARYKPSLRGPVPLLYREWLAASRRPQVDVYRTETKIGADYNRYTTDRAASRIGMLAG